MIIKHKLCLSDEETVEQIQENPYLQYFVGFPAFTTQLPFVPSLFVDIRKRMDKTLFANFEEEIIHVVEDKKSAAKQDDDEPPSTTASPKQNQDAEAIEPQISCAPEHKGKLILDATVAPQKIRFPTDISLLNEAREISEKIIDTLYPHSNLAKKPRTYRQRARKDFLALVKQRRPRAKVRRKAIRKQLNYLKRNLKHIESLWNDVYLPTASPCSLEQYHQAPKRLPLPLLNKL